MTASFTMMIVGLLTWRPVPIRAERPPPYDGLTADIVAERNRSLTIMIHDEAQAALDR